MPFAVTCMTQRLSKPDEERQICQDINVSGISKNDANELIFKIEIELVNTGNKLTITKRKGVRYVTIRV